jgi:GGDEF domain-containing protein
MRRAVISHAGIPPVSPSRKPMAAEPQNPEPQRRALSRRAVLLLVLLAAAALWAAWPGATLVHVLLGIALAATAAAYALWTRRPPAAASAAPPLVSRTEVIQAGDRLLARTREKAQPLSLAIVEVSDIADVERLFGHDVAEAIMGRLAAMLRALATARGLAARTGQTQFSLLLPGVEPQDALLALRTAFGETGCLEHESNDELMLLPDVKVDAVGPEHASVASVYIELCAAMALIRPTPAAASPAEVPTDRAELVQAQERRASLYAPTLPMTP